MARSNIRVLALDLDGTLTNDEKIVTPRTRAALDAAAAQGAPQSNDKAFLSRFISNVSNARSSRSFSIFSNF